MNNKATQLTVLLVTVLTLVVAGALLTFAPLSASGNRPQRVVSVAMATLPPPYTTFPTDVPALDSAESDTTPSNDDMQRVAAVTPAPTDAPPEPVATSVEPSNPLAVPLRPQAQRQPAASSRVVSAEIQQAAIEQSQPDSPLIGAPQEPVTMVAAPPDTQMKHAALSAEAVGVQGLGPTAFEPVATAIATPLDDPAQAPFGGVPWPIPGPIQAEDYDTGGQGIAYRDDDPENQGGAYRPDEGVDLIADPVAIGWTSPQEWVEYTVQINQTDRYQVAFHYQTEAGATPQVMLFLNGRGISGPIQLPSTSSDQWQTHVVSHIPMIAGERVLRVALDGGVILDMMTFAPGEPTATPSPTGTPIPPTPTPTGTPIPPTVTPTPTSTVIPPTPTSTAIPPTPTSTAVPPTPTPAPTSTPIPPTPTPEPDNRLCDPSLHSTFVLHGHYNAQHDCYYDHSHVAPGEWPSDLFLSYTGQSLSYPWLTMGGMENEPWPAGKHEAYNFHSGQVDGTWYTENAASASMRFEVEWHGMSNNLGMRTRFHSFAALLRIPHDTAGEGHIFWGGWMDCGQRITIDGNDNWYTVDEGRPQPGGTALKHTQIVNNSQTWYCQLPDLPVENVVGQQYGAQIGRTTPDNLFAPLDAYCGPDEGAECTSRGQSQEVALLLFDVSAPWTDFLDADGNGWIEHYEGYTDRYGNIQPEGTCTGRGLDCVPLVIHNVERLRYKAQGNVFHRTTTDMPHLLNWWNRVE